MSYGRSKTEQVGESGFQFMQGDPGSQQFLGQWGDMLAQARGDLDRFSPENIAQSFFRQTQGDFGRIGANAMEQYRDQFMEPARIAARQAGRGVESAFEAKNSIFAGGFGEAYGRGVAQPFAQAGLGMAQGAMGLQGTANQGLMGIFGQGQGIAGQRVAQLEGPYGLGLQAVYQEPQYATDSYQFGFL